MKNERRSNKLQFTPERLCELGYVELPDGTWGKPSSADLDRHQGRVDSKQAGTLDQIQRTKPEPEAGSQKRGARVAASKGSRRKRPHTMIVTLTCHVPRYFDSDNATIATKAIRDEIAAWLGVDDGDRRILWEVDQTLSRGKPGVCVAIRQIDDN